MFSKELFFRYRSRLFANSKPKESLIILREEAKKKLGVSETR